MQQFTAIRRLWLALVVMCLAVLPAVGAEVASGAAGVKAAEQVPWRVGVALSTFLPSSARTRDRFGSAWNGISLTVLLTESATVPRDAYQLDFGYTGRSQHGDFVYLLPIGVSYQHTLGACPGGRFFVGASADLVFSNLRVEEDNIHAHIRVVPAGSVFAGAYLWHGWQFRVRYNLVAPIAGYDFSGTSLAVVIPL